MVLSAARSTASLNLYTLRLTLSQRSSATVRPGVAAQPAARIVINTAAAARSGLSMRRESPNDECGGQAAAGIVSTRTTAIAAVLLHRSARGAFGQRLLHFLEAGLEARA